MILPNDILLRDSSDGHTVWVSQRMVVENCDLSEGYLRTHGRDRYKASLPPSWQKVTDQEEFFLGKKEGRSWRWGKKNGQYYYDIDTIPNRKPVCYRDKLPAKDDLIRLVKENELKENRERKTEMQKVVIKQMQKFIDYNDVNYFAGYTVGGKNIFESIKVDQLVEAAAWCRFIRRATSKRLYKQMGFAKQTDFLDACAGVISSRDLEGLRVKTIGSLRKKISQAPEDTDALRRYLVSEKYGNDNRRVIGKEILVDYETGEILKYDQHEVAIMNYWLNPGGSTKDSKKDLWQQYASDMDALGLKAVSPSTFTHYTNRWDKKILSKERHGADYHKNNFKPYVPSKHLEYANSLWASDGSGIVPYRYRNQEGKWCTMKLYVMMVTDVASRYIVGYSVSKQSLHKEDPVMLRSAMQMALRNNGRTEVLDFISDNHGAYTSAESKAYLRQVCRTFRTIEPGNSQANPAEMMFRLFKRRFKNFFNLQETSWDARSLESKANPDRYDLMGLPTYEEAILKLQQAVDDWNNTELSNGLTPARWFHNFKNAKAGEYDDRRWRLITGEVSKKDLTYSRGIMELRRGADKYIFDVPTDTDTISLIAKHIGYSPKFDATVYWDKGGADVYSPAGVYMFTCPLAPLAAKSETEATHESHAALAHYQKKRTAFDEMVDGYTGDIAEAKDVMSRSYAFNIQGSGTKERYNGMMEGVNQAAFNRALEKRKAKEERAVVRENLKKAKATENASLLYKRNKISDISKYTK